MKRHLLFKSLLLLCALVVGSTSVWATDEYSYTFNASSGAAKGANTLGSMSWTLATDPSNAYLANEASGLHIGSGSKGVKTITLSSSSFSGVISKVVVNTKGNGTNGTVGVTVNGTAYTAKNSKNSIGSSSADLEFTGSQSGEIVITLGYPEKQDKNIYVSRIDVTYNYTASTAALDHISLSGTYPTEFFVGDAFSTEGMTVTAHYDDSTSEDVTGSATFTGYNMSTTGNQTVTVSYTKGAVTKTATYNITVLPVPTAVVTLDFTDAGWGFPSSDYDKTEKSYTNNGYTITLGAHATGGHKVRKSGDDIVSLIYGKSGATLTLPAFGFNVSKIKVYGASSASTAVTFNVFVGDNAASTAATSSVNDHEFVISSDKRAVGTIYTIKVTNANNCQISKIEVYGNGCEAGLVQSYGWATYIPTVDVEYPANTAYVVTDASVNDGLTLAAVTQVPAGTPLLLKGTGAKTAIKLDAAASDPTTNLLSVCNGTIDDGKYAYVLAKNGTGACFKQWAGPAATLNGRVVLLLDKAAAARGIFELDDDATGIKQVETSKQNAEGFYNLAGQRIANPTKGLYIVNGKKVIIK